MENSRLLTFLLISLAIVIGYNELMQRSHPELAHRKAAVAVTPTPEHAASAPAAAGVVESSISQAPSRTITIDTKLYEARLTTRGGRIESFLLKDYKQTSARNSPLYQMVAGGDRYPVGMLIARGAAVGDDGGVVYSSVAPSQIDAATGVATVVLTGVTADGIKLEKTFTFKPDSYVFKVTASAAAPADVKLGGIGFQMSRTLKANEGFHDIPELEADVKGKLLTKEQKAIEKGVAPVVGKIAFAGFGDRYFLSALIPSELGTGTLSMDYVGSEADARMLFEGATAASSEVYMGPKELDVLEAANPALSKAINLGWSTMVALPFLKLLKLFHRIAPNYGLAIILLTVVVRLLTLPMSIKGQRSMMKMQRLQPQVERIREKHKDDQERLNREMVDLYKRNHVNPLGGCLPMVVQLPVFFGLYEALLNAIELRHAPFIGWITDLSAPDCLPVSWMPKLPLTDCHGIPVLVILMTVTAFLQQWMMPRQPDPSQQKIMMYMPVAFSLIFINLPAGLTLYYFASNLLGVAQQFILNREFKQLPAAT